MNHELDRGISRRISITEVQAVVAGAFNLPRAELLSRSRRQPVSNARHIAMYLSRELAGRGRTAESHARTRLSYPRIGLAFGRDHSSVIHACNHIARRRQFDQGFAQLLDQLASDLRAIAPALSAAA